MRPSCCCSRPVSDLDLLQDPISSLRHHNGRSCPSCDSCQHYLLFITLSVHNLKSSPCCLFLSKQLLWKFSVCSSFWIWLPWHQVTNSKTTVVTVLEIRGMCVRLTFFFFLPCLELQTGHMEVLQRQQESQSMWSSELLIQHASWVFSTQRFWKLFRIY